MMEINTNIVILVGKIVSDMEVYHVIKGEEYFKTEVSVIRKSGEKDILPIVISEKLVDKNMIKGKFISIEGQIRTYNREDGGIETYLFAKDADIAKDNTYKNTVKLEGFLCKKGIFKTTYSGRKIANFLLAVNRAYGKSDYIPILAWGKNAKYVERQEMPVQFALEGRFQSRQYCKRNNENKKIERITYEISASSINMVKEDREVFVQVK